MKLSGRKNRLNYGSEGTPPLRKVLGFIQKKLSFIIYYLIIGGILVTIVSVGWERIVYINGEGYIRSPRVTLRSHRPYRIDTVFAELGDTVLSGSPLYSWRVIPRERDCTATTERRERKNRLEQELANIRITIREKKRNRRNLRNVIEKNKKLLAYDLQSEENLSRLERMYINLGSELKAEYERAALLQREIKELPAKHFSTSSHRILAGREYAHTDGEITQPIPPAGSFIPEGGETGEITEVTTTQDLPSLTFLSGKEGLRLRIHHRAVTRKPVFEKHRRGFSLILPSPGRHTRIMRNDTELNRMGIRKFSLQSDKKELKISVDIPAVDIHRAERSVRGDTLFLQLSGDSLPQLHRRISLDHRLPHTECIGFADPAKGKRIFPGKQVTMVLPDNRRIPGTIDHVYSTTRPLPQMFREKYDVSLPRISFRIIPESPDDLPGINRLQFRILIPRKVFNEL
ncbi:MAG: hypothetical protein ACQEQV_08305 [Fibrobacterota bacterium]